MPELLLHTIYHTLLDTAKLLPFLFLTYLLMEYLEHRSGGATERILRGSGKVGPLFGSLLGALPQCGFSAAAAGLYAGRVITAGTLIAVFLSTSDEMLPIMLSSGAPVGKLLSILGVKIVIGIAAGFAVDGASRLLCRQDRFDEQQIEDICERENCHCGDRFVLSALKHTGYVAIFILIVSFLLNLTVELVGEDALASLLSDRPVLGNLLAALVGLIPNCASSVVLTQLYLGGVIPVGAMLSGLLVNSGIALTILFRNNRPVRDSLRILVILFCIGLGAGILVDLLGFLA